jgi:hypothetical protein
MPIADVGSPSRDVDFRGFEDPDERLTCHQSVRDDRKEKQETLDVKVYPDFLDRKCKDSTPNPA